ncbi:MAG TPA: ABC transporter ATP-binding protein [Kiritimatiellia bacterium]|nr:ABC transporter ATP-binding protein [Kiritimatiellia bacterium]HPS08768.1 ABC transporter ATP-binding protein [Kiritimatiellia bacterium]
MNMIEINSVTVRYNGTTALDGVTLSVGCGERVAFLGPSGCGKTTLLRLVAGFIAPDAGSVSIDGERVAADGRNLRPPEGRNVGMVFQDLALWPHLTVRGNIEFGLKAKGMPGDERRGRVLETLGLVGMGEYADRKPSELSGGQQQRVALARSLVLEPKVLMMDEPLSSLDQELNQRLRKEILRLQEKLGFTLLYVTHDREEAFDIAMRVVLMKNGLVQGD